MYFLTCALPLLLTRERSLRYWHAAALTLEPRLSSKWIANIAFFGLVLSLPVPHTSFLLPNSDLYRPTPPALSTILENILPSVNTKVHLSRGLQSTAPLVQHCAALALAKALAKLGAARAVPSQIEAQKLLNTLAVDQFAIPGDAGFPLNAHYAPPAGRSDAGAWREPFG